MTRILAMVRGPADLLEQAIGRDVNQDLIPEILQTALRVRGEAVPWRGPAQNPRSRRTCSSIRN